MTKEDKRRRANQVEASAGPLYVKDRVSKALEAAGGDRPQQAFSDLLAIGGDVVHDAAKEEKTFERGKQLKKLCQKFAMKTSNWQPASAWYESGPGHSPLRGVRIGEVAYPGSRMGSKPQR